MSPECLDDAGTSGYSTRANDIWSLGVILINILSNKNPWCEPSTSDPMYAEFVRSLPISESLFFKKHFRVDDHLDNILKGCFNPDPEARWDINTLYTAVSALLPSDAVVPVTVPSAVSPAVPSSLFSSLESWGMDEFDAEMDWSQVPVFDDATPKKRKIRHRNKKKKVEPVSTDLVSVDPAQDLINSVTAVFSKMLNVGSQDDAGINLAHGFRIAFFAL